MGTLVLAILGIIDLCIKYGQFLKEKVVLYRHTDEIVKLDRFVVELVEGEVHTLLHFFKSISKQMTPSFGSELQQILQVLRDQLESVANALP